jgi:hypothetical protein
VNPPICFPGWLISLYFGNFCYGLLIYIYLAGKLNFLNLITEKIRPKEINGFSPFNVIFSTQKASLKNQKIQG